MFSFFKKDKEALPANFTKYAPLVLASEQVMGPKRLPVCFAFRVAPNNEADSGWVFWSGSESQAYVDDSANSHVCPLLSFLELDPSLLNIIKYPIGTAWERASAKDEWREVLDFNFDD